MGLYYRVKNGKEEEFEATFKNVIMYLSTSVPGFKGAKLYKEVSNAQEYMIYSEWESTDAFAAFMKSREFSDTIAKGKEIIDGMPRHKIFKGVEEAD